MLKTNRKKTFYGFEHGCGSKKKIIRSISLYYRCAVILLLLCYCCIIVPLLYHRCLSFYYVCTIVVPSLYHRCTTFVPSLYHRCTTFVVWMTWIHLLETISLEWYKRLSSSTFIMGIGSPNLKDYWLGVYHLVKCLFMLLHCSKSRGYSR